MSEIINLDDFRTSPESERVQTALQAAEELVSEIADWDGVDAKELAYIIEQFVYECGFTKPAPGEVTAVLGFPGTTGGTAPIPEDDHVDQFLAALAPASRPKPLT